MIEAEKLDGVAGRHLPTLVVGHTRSLRLKHLDGFRPARHHVGKIRRPYHPVYSDFMTQLHPDMVLEKSPVGVLFQIFAGAAL